MATLSAPLDAFVAGLPGAWSPVGVELDAMTTAREVLHAADAIVPFIEQVGPWAIGDLVLFLCESGWNYATLSARWKIPQQTLKNRARVSRAYEKYLRRYAIPWSHHALVAVFSTVSERTAWLDRVEQEQWSCKELCRRIRQELKPEDESAVPLLLIEGDDEEELRRNTPLQNSLQRFFDPDSETVRLPSAGVLDAPAAGQGDDWPLPAAAASAIERETSPAPQTLAAAPISTLRLATLATPTATAQPAPPTSTSTKAVACPLAVIDDDCLLEDILPPEGRTLLRRLIHTKGKDFVGDQIMTLLRQLMEEAA